MIRNVRKTRQRRGMERRERVLVSVWMRDGRGGRRTRREEGRVSVMTDILTGRERRPAFQWGACISINERSFQFKKGRRRPDCVVRGLTTTNILREAGRDL